jgi:hypothetical protein
MPKPSAAKTGDHADYRARHRCLPPASWLILAARWFVSVPPAGRAAPNKRSIDPTISLHPEAGTG